jgi:serine protease
VAAVIYNNAPALFSGTLGGVSTGIPSVGTSGHDGVGAAHLVGQQATVTTGPGHYSFYDGTSMATPHVSGVAALVWSHNTAWTNQQVRDALAATAEDLGSTGRDNTYGWGLVQAKAALDHLNGIDPGDPGDPEDPGDPDPGDPGEPPPAGISLTATGTKLRGSNVANLSWTGGATSTVRILRNNSLLATVANNGSYSNNTGTKGSASFTYQVCEALSSTVCSATVTVTW